MQNTASPVIPFAPSILREYDIRGIVGETLTTDTALTLGRTFGTTVKRDGKTTVCVAYDGRVTSPSLKTALIEGLRDAGCAVTDLGLGPTPMSYFAGHHLPSDAVVMVTGSHNPAPYNGFKMVLGNKPFYGAKIQKLGAMALQNDWDQAPVRGSVTTQDITDAYVARLLKDITYTRPLTVVWDIGNGAAGAVIDQLVAGLPGTHHLLFKDVDGTFPNHHPDPTVDKNLKDLQQAVATHKADLGIAFDGDADRIGVVDHTGRILRCDMLLALYAADVLTRHPGAAIIGDVKCSVVLFDEITRMGGQAVMGQTGHSLVKAKMAETKAPLAGELSGHIFFADGFYGHDDALYCAIRLLNLLGSGKNLADLTAHLPVMLSTPEGRIDVREEDKFPLMGRLAALLPQHLPQSGYRISTIDGVRADGPEGWVLLRASNTQNCIVTRIEARNTTALNGLRKSLQTVLGMEQLTLPKELL